MLRRLLAMSVCLVVGVSAFVSAQEASAQKGETLKGKQGDKQTQDVGAADERQGASADGEGLEQFLKVLKPRSIGPANMGGRITDHAVFEAEPRIQYVATATGGLWKTLNAGTTWRCVFERESSVSLGAVAVSPVNPNVVWAGTGEGNPRNSVSWGDGVYRSVDGGKTWHHVGLKETAHIGKIVVHPKDANVAYVAAVGRFWGKNKERGVFKTTDGGASWTHALAINEDTGAIDLAMDPLNAEILYATAYTVRRDAFSGGNPKVQTSQNAGIYKTTDGGKTWKRLTRGLPTRALGRCGISIYRKNPDIVYAVVQTDQTAVTVQGQGPNQRKLSPEYGGIFRSEDKGETWQHLNSLCPRPFYYGQIRVDPNDDKRIYVLGVQFFLSNNGGRLFSEGNQAKGTHADYHTLWINPRESHHLVLGCDGGLNISHDKGVTWERLRNLPISQFYCVGIDQRPNYNVYGGLQDNGTWGAPSRTLNASGLMLSDWFQLLGFDGYYCEVDSKDANTLYCEGQYGLLRRVNVNTGASVDIRPRLDGKGLKSNIDPRPDAVTPGYRFNWSSPILISPHDSHTIFYGANVVFRSTDRGGKWSIISPDLTLGKPGPSAYQGHTITTLSESKLRKGLLYVGTDDGRMHRSDDGGTTWKELTANLKGVPKDRWVARFEASHHEADAVFLAITRYRNDDRATYFFKSSDRGESWAPLVASLPKQAPVHAFREDPVNPKLLYLGTEYGMYVSANAGKKWTKHPLLPNVPVHDFAIHKERRELVIATHGRGIYIMDASPLQQTTLDLVKKAAHLFEIPPHHVHRPRVKYRPGSKEFVGESPPYGVVVHFFLSKRPDEAPAVTVANEKGDILAKLRGDRSAGLQTLVWSAMQPKTAAGVYRPVAPGAYDITLQAGGLTETRRIEVSVEQ